MSLSNLLQCSAINRILLRNDIVQVDSGWRLLDVTGCHIHKHLLFTSHVDMGRGHGPALVKPVCRCVMCHTVTTSATDEGVDSFTGSRRHIWPPALSLSSFTTAHPANHEPSYYYYYHWNRRQGKDGNKRSKRHLHYFSLVLYLLQNVKIHNNFTVQVFALISFSHYSDVSLLQSDCDSSDDHWKLTTSSCISVLTNSAVTVFNPVFTARCTLVQSAVLRSHVVCLSVCLSVCL